VALDLVEKPAAVTEQEEEPAAGGSAHERESDEGGTLEEEPERTEQQRRRQRKQGLKRRGQAADLEAANSLGAENLECETTAAATSPGSLSHASHPSVAVSHEQAAAGASLGSGTPCAKESLEDFSKEEQEEPQQQRGRAWHDDDGTDEARVEEPQQQQQPQEETLAEAEELQEEASSATGPQQEDQGHTEMPVHEAPVAEAAQEERKDQAHSELPGGETPGTGAAQEEPKDRRLHSAGPRPERPARARASSPAGSSRPVPGVPRDQRSAGSSCASDERRSGSVGTARGQPGGRLAGCQWRPTLRLDSRGPAATGVGPPPLDTAVHELQGKPARGTQKAEGPVRQKARFHADEPAPAVLPSARSAPSEFSQWKPTLWQAGSEPGFSPSARPDGA